MQKQSRIRSLTVLLMVALWLPAGAGPAFAGVAAEEAKQAIVAVKGLQCPFCAYGVQKHLKKLPGVTRVDVDLEQNQAVLTMPADAKVTDDDIRKAVRKAGFTPGKIEWKYTEKD